MVRVNQSSEDDRTAAAYFRVSTQEQEEFGNSIDIQIESADKYAKEHNLNLKYKFKEAKSASAKVTSRKDNIISQPSNVLTTRPEFRRLIDKALNKEFKHLILYSHDRYTRSFDEFISLGVLFNSLGVVLHYSRPGEKLDSKDEAINRFFELMLSNIAELESNIIGSRVKLGGIANTKRGIWPGGRRPFGFNLDTFENGKKRNSVLKVNNNEILIVNEIYNLYMIGYSPSQIAEEMKMRHRDIDNHRWTRSFISSIMNNEVYTGRIVWNRRGGFRNPVKHSDEEIERSLNTISGDGILKLGDWKIINEIKDKQYGRNAKYFSTPFLLKDKLYCGICKKPMKCKNNGPGKKSVYYCGTRLLESNKKRKSEFIIEKDKIEKIVMNKLIEIIQHEVDSKCQQLWDLYNERIPVIKQQLKDATEGNNELIKANEHMQGDYNTFKGKRDNFLGIIAEYKRANNPIELGETEKQYEVCNKEYEEEFEEIDMFFEAIDQYQTHLIINQKYLQDSREKLKKKSQASFMTRKQLEQKVSEMLLYVTDYSEVIKSSLPENKVQEIKNRRARMFIDKILGRVYAKGNPNSLILDISINLPHENFEDFILDGISEGPIDSDIL